MSIAARLDHSYGPPGPFNHLGHFRPLGIVVMVLGFIFFWPVGVATLAFLIWSGRMGCWHHTGEHGFAGSNWAGHNWQERMEARRARWEQKWAARCGQGRTGSSGNRAFDAYRDETLKRLEDEEKEFRDFLDKLRFAKDKAEFDNFLVNRRPPSAPDAPSQN